MTAGWFFFAGVLAGALAALGVLALFVRSRCDCLACQERRARR